MTDPDSALRMILKAVVPLALEDIPLKKSSGRILAVNLRAGCDLPRFNNSAMDGFAVRFRDLGRAREDAPAALALVDVVRAGAADGRRIGRGQAAAVMTGAPVPSGADAVVPRELARTSDGIVHILKRPLPGQHVRRRAMDVRRGAPLLPAGRALRPYEIALLSSQGISRVKVVRQPRVAVISSGDELVDFRRTPGPGKIRDANRPALAAMLRGWGFTALDSGIAPDEPASMARKFSAALKDCDALLISGGVSVGDFDYTRPVLEKMGFKTLLWRVKIRPGKPLLFGLWRGKPVFGLPGSPISSLVCCEVFVRPALERLRGAGTQEEPFPLSGALRKSFDKPAGLRQYLFCRARGKSGGYSLEVLKPQGSGLLLMGSRANALAIGPIGTARLKPGMELSFKWL